MSEYTPTTENIRQTFAYVRAGLDHDDGYPFVMEFHVEAFDRWLAHVKAEAWDEGATRERAAEPDAALVAAQGAGVAPQELCPQPCEHLSAEDAREGRDCREHPCTCPTASSSDREKLIEEARAVAGAKSLYAHTSVAHLLTRLADALVAAQGAAPQASKKSCGPCRRGQHGCCDGNEYLRCECSQGAAPVLPSSVVDEDALAEVIAIARNRWAIYGTEAEPLEKHQARAVAEWLKGQGR